MLIFRNHKPHASVKGSAPHFCEGLTAPQFCEGLEAAQFCERLQPFTECNPRNNIRQIIGPQYARVRVRTHAREPAERKYNNEYDD